MEEQSKIISKKDFINLIELSPILSIEFKQNLISKYIELENKEIKEIIKTLAKQEKIFYGEVKSVKIKSSLSKIKEQEKNEKESEYLELDSILDTI